jgi:hypothetical protein
MNPGDGGGICTIKDLVAREGSRPVRVLENPKSLGSGLMGAGSPGGLSSNERRLGGSVMGRPGGFGGSFPVDMGLSGTFSGLLGGVLNGDT